MSTRDEWKHVPQGRNGVCVCVSIRNQGQSLSSPLGSLPLVRPSVWLFINQGRGGSDPLNSG